MSVAMDFGARHSVLRITVTGYVSNEIMLDTYAVVAKYVAAHGACRAITDPSGVTKFDVSPSAMRALTKETPAIPKGHMRVIVAPEDSKYGMVRMFQIITELTRPDLQVVRTLDAAYHLLNVESPEFVPVAPE
jgi:hypothetical protein